jgi:hypothetical protein
VRGQRDLAHAAIVDCRLNQLGGLRMLAERLDGDARNQPRTGRNLGRWFVGRRFLTEETHTFISLPPVAPTDQSP